jgi:hypothetical protein
MVETERRMIGTVDGHELRSVAQLRMLHALATRLNALDNIDAIGEAITAELRTLIDYHNCRIYLLLEDGVTLWPVAFRGELTEYEAETLDELVTKVGEGSRPRGGHRQDLLRCRRRARRHRRPDRGPPRSTSRSWPCP